MPDDRNFKLQLRLDGPLVADHRLPLSELVRIAGRLHDVLRDTAVVLAGLGPSGTSGRAQRAVEQAIDLQVVAGPRIGSFVLDFEPAVEPSPDQEQLDIELGPSLSERAVNAVVDGLETLDEGVDQLPSGFDRGVLKAVLPLRTALKRGLTSIRLEASTGDYVRATTVDSAKLDLVERLISKPTTAQATAEGVLEMVDFRQLECRIDRPPQASVTVFFDERDRWRVHAAAMQFVRVVGEGQFEPGASEPSKIWASRVDVLYESLQFDPNAFWQERALEQLAADQEVAAFRMPEDVEADPWRDDAEAAQLIEAIRGVA